MYTVYYRQKRRLEQIWREREREKRERKEREKEGERERVRERKLSRSRSRKRNIRDKTFKIPVLSLFFPMELSWYHIPSLQQFVPWFQYHRSVLSTPGLDSQAWTREYP